jgi:hypothetical protein
MRRSGMSKVLSKLYLNRSDQSPFFMVRVLSVLFLCFASSFIVV